jgi:glutathione synthase/RimK-type ligase-like ATP-grasp enzyme
MVSLCIVIEINDNPNIDAGIEDKILKERLYEIIMEVFLTRIKSQK